MFDYNFSNCSPLKLPLISPFRNIEYPNPSHESVQDTSRSFWKRLGFIIFLVFLVPISLRAESTVLFLGDSLTAGYGVEKDQAFPQLVSDKLQQMGYKEVKVINGGFSGSTTASAIQRMKWYMRIKPDILILELGANDGLRGQSIESVKANLAKTIEFARQNKITTILVGMKLPVNYGSEYTREFEELFKSLARKYSLPLIPFLLEGVAGIPQLNQSDGIHPNPEGHKIVAETVLKYLLPFLNKTS